MGSHGVDHRVWLLRLGAAKPGVLLGRVTALVLGAALLVNALVLAVERLPHIRRVSVSSAAAHELAGVLGETPRNAEVISSFGVMGRFSARRYIYPLIRVDQSFPVFTRDVVFVFAPAQGNNGGVAPSAVTADIVAIEHSLHARLLANSSGVIALRWAPPAGVDSVQLP